MQYKGKKVKDSEKTREMFHQQQTNEDGSMQWVLYIANETGNVMKYFWTHLSELIDKLLGFRLRNTVLLLPFVLQFSLDQVPNFLDSRNIMPLLQTDFNNWFPSLGDPIPFKEHHLLLQDFLKFEELEFVGEYIFPLDIFNINMKYLPCNSQQKRLTNS